jgi:hypothetical protein
MRLTRGMLTEQPDLANHLAERIRAEIPFYRASHRVPADALEQSVREHLSALVDQAAFPDRPVAVPLALGEQRARDGVELADVLDALRIGANFLWGQIVDYARRTGAATESELVDIASEVWMMHDTYVRSMAAGYREEQARVLLSRQQERLGLVYGLLTARGREAASPWNAVDRLGLSRSVGFVVVAAITPTAGRIPLPRIEQSFTDAGVPSAWVMVANVQLGIISQATPSWPEEMAVEVARWGASVGASPVIGDYTRVGFAVRLARIALATAEPGVIAEFDQAPVAMAAAGSPDITERIVESVLGSLSSVAHADRVLLLETLEAWLGSDGSVSGVADRLGVHENTVRNRLRRIATVTGRDPLRPREAAELYLALWGRRTASHGAADVV